MVSISNQNPENTVRPDGQQPPVANPAPVEKAGIFRVGLTHAQAISENLTSLFNKYNTVDDDVISQEEFDVFQRENPVEEGENVEDSTQTNTTEDSSQPEEPEQPTNETVDSPTEEPEAPESSTPQTEIPVSKGQMVAAGMERPSDVTAKGNKPSLTESFRGTAAKKILSHVGAESDGVSSSDVSSVRSNTPTSSRSASLWGSGKDTQRTLYGMCVSITSQVHESAEVRANETVDAAEDADARAKAIGAAKEERIRISTKAAKDTMDKGLKEDLDKTKENSLINTIITKLHEKDLTEDDIKDFEKYGIDVSKLETPEDIEEAAERYIRAKYREKLSEKIEEKKGGVVALSVSQATQESDVLNQDDKDNIAVRVQSSSVTDEVKRGMANAHLENYDGSKVKDKEASDKALATSMQIAEQQSIETLYRNNGNMVDDLNRIAQDVANNSTDESRKTMLSNIVRDSAEIVAKGPVPKSETSSKTPVQTSKQETTTSTVSNPINEQAQAIADIRKASQLLIQQQMEKENSNGSVNIPRHLQNVFATVKEYIEFTGSGMTISQYQTTKKLMQSDVISAVDEIVQNYTTLPDAYKPKVLTLFDAMKDQTRAELYLTGSEELRGFMDKYQYMTPSKLLTHLQNHPADMKGVTRSVGLMIKEFQKEEQKKA